MEPDPDAESMLRLKNGEDLALNDLMNRWQQRLVAFIYRYIGNGADAIDLAQETFMRVFEARHRYTARAKFSTWLFTIAANLCRNYLRRFQRHGKPADDSFDVRSADAIEQIPSVDAPPDQAAVQSELISLVKECIGKLPHDCKTIILLHEYEDLSYEEIAGVLGCSVKAVEMRLYRARKLLREIVSGTGVRERG